MNPSIVLQFADLFDLARYIKLIHASAYRIDTSKLTLKIELTEFEMAIAVEQYNATVVNQTETV